APVWLIPGTLRQFGRYFFIDTGVRNDSPCARWSGRRGPRVPADSYSAGHRRPQQSHRSHRSPPAATRAGRRRGRRLTAVKALVKTAPEPGLHLVDVPEPEYGPGDVLIKVAATGICGTDLHIASWDPWAQSRVSAPLIVGHEFSGRVVAVGSGVTDVAVGDFVSGEGHLVCGRCRNCRAGRRHLCINTRGIGVQVDGAFAQFISIPSQNVWVHPHEIGFDVAAIFDPFGNAVHTALTFPMLGEDVLITGAGPIGILAAMVSRHAGARNVVISDLSPTRLALAERLGVSMALDARSSSPRDAHERLGMKEGFDVGMEMSGSPAA